MRHPSSRRSIIGLSILLAVPLPITAADAPTARAGFARADITPPLGIILGGRGCRQTPADGVLDSLSAGVTILKDPRQNTLVVASLDLIGLTQERSDHIRTDISQRLALPIDHVILNCSHTHSGPFTYRELMAGCGPTRDDERNYMRDLARKITDLALTAAANLTPVTVHVHHATCDVGINRRGKTASGTTAMIPNADGPYDPAVWILRLATPDGKTRAILFSYACHPVIVYGHAYTKISAEYPGVARREIRAALGPDVHAQFLQGPAGNIRPRCLGDLEKRKFRKSTPDDIENAGRQLAAAVLTGLQQPGRALNLQLAAHTDTVFLKRAAPPPKSIYEKNAEKKNYPGPGARHWLEQYEQQAPLPKGTNWPVGVIRLAKDQWILTLAGEPVVQWAELAKKWFADKPVTVIGYTPNIICYLPVDEILPDGRYEVASSNYYRLDTPAPFAPGLNDTIRKSVLRQIAYLQADAD